VSYTEQKKIDDFRNMKEISMLNKVLAAIKIGCSCCGTIFGICKSCYRNQKYCSEECRIAGYRENHRIAQRKYSSKEKIKKKHAEDEAKRRKKKKGEEVKSKNQVIKMCMCIMMLMYSTLFLLDPDCNNGVCCKCGKEFGVVLEYREPLDDENCIYKFS